MKCRILPDKTAWELRQLARWHGVLTSHVDMSRRRQEASPEALLAVLRTLGVPVSYLREVPQALRETQSRKTGRVVEPVHVAWEGKRAIIPL